MLYELGISSKGTNIYNILTLKKSMSKVIPQATPRHSSLLTKIINATAEQLYCPPISVDSQAKTVKILDGSGGRPAFFTEAISLIAYIPRGYKVTHESQEYKIQ